MGSRLLFGKVNLGRKVISGLMAIIFALGPVGIPYAQTVKLSAPGTRVSLSASFAPPILKGVKLYPDNPFRLDFILDRDSVSDSADQLKSESTRLIKYFLASITVPESDLWVNLSPYEKDRIVPDAFGVTEMGRDLLAQDYMLKQITASVIYPEGEIGKAFWAKVYDEARKQYGTADVPVDTFNKVWIVPEKAVVYESKDSAYVVESRLKVMLEEDYLALEKNTTAADQTTRATNKFGSDIVREIVIPILEKEVNEGKNFAQLRQVYHSLILAVWYKDKVRESLLGKAYVDRNKTGGVDIEDKREKEKIWAQYVEAFKKGVYSYIKEDLDPATQQLVPRKYFSGGLRLNVRAVKSPAQRSQVPEGLDYAEIVNVRLDASMTGTDSDSAAVGAMVLKGDWVKNRNDGRVARVVAISMKFGGAFVASLSYSTVDSEGRIVEIDNISLGLEELYTGFEKVEEPFKVGSAGRKTLGMSRVMGYREGIRVRDDRNPMYGDGVVVVVWHNDISVFYPGREPVRYSGSSLGDLTEIIVDESNRPLPPKRLKATQFYIGETVRDESRPELGEGRVISFLLDVSLAEGKLADSLLVQYPSRGTQGERNVTYKDDFGGEEARILNLNVVKTEDMDKQIVGFEKEFADVLSMRTFLRMLDNGVVQTPFNVRYDNQRAKYVLEVLNPTLSSRSEQERLIVENAWFSAEEVMWQQSAYAIAMYEGYLDKLAEIQDSNVFFDGTEVLFVGPDNQLKEVEYILKRFPGIKKVVISELSLKNARIMIERAHELGLQDKIEVSRMNFIRVNDMPELWKGRFSAAFSFRVFEHTINTGMIIDEAWKGLQNVLTRPGIYIGSLALSDQRLAPESPNDILSVRMMNMKNEDDRMLVITDSSSAAPVIVERLTLKEVIPAAVPDPVNSSNDVMEVNPEIINLLGENEGEVHAEDEDFAGVVMRQMLAFLYRLREEIARSVPSAPNVLLIGGSHMDVAEILRHYPQARIKVVNLSREYLSGIRNQYQEIFSTGQLQLFLADAQHLSSYKDADGSPYFLEGAFDIVAAPGVDATALPGKVGRTILSQIAEQEVLLARKGGLIMHCYNVLDWRDSLTFQARAVEDGELEFVGEQEYMSSSLYRRTDKAMAPNKGGIDLIRDKMGVLVKSSGDGVPFKFDPAMIQQLQNASGFTPVVIDIQPMIMTVPMFLGLTDDHAAAETLSMR